MIFFDIIIGMKLGVITAMDCEFEQVKAMLTNPLNGEAGGRPLSHGRIGENEIVLMACGIGKVNAAIGAIDMIRTYKPDAIISTGVAGGLNGEIAGVMDVVAGSEVAYHDVDCGPYSAYGQVQGFPPRFIADQRLLDAATSLNSDVKIVPALIASGDRFISTQEDLAPIKKLYPEAAAVDMESGAIAQTCYFAKVPFLSFRIISDIPGVENHYSKYADFWERMGNTSFGVTKAFLERIAK